MPLSTAEILIQLRALSNHLPENEIDRKQIAEAAKDLARAAEPLQDQTQRLLYSNLVLPIVRVAVDLDLLELLSIPVGKVYATEALAATTKVDSLLLSKTPFTCHLFESILMGKLESCVS